MMNGHDGLSGTPHLHTPKKTTINKYSIWFIFKLEYIKKIKIKTFNNNTQLERHTITNRRRRRHLKFKKQFQM